MSTWSFEYQRSRSLLDLGQNLSDSILLNEYMKLWVPKVRVIDWPWSESPRFNTIKPLGPLKPNFMWSLLWMGERRLVQRSTWQRWPPCPYMVKNIKDIFLCNRKADDLETWYTTLCTRVLPSLFKWCPWVDLNLFYGKVKVILQKRSKQWIFQKLL